MPPPPTSGEARQGQPEDRGDPKRSERAGTACPDGGVGGLDQGDGVGSQFGIDRQVVDQALELGPAVGEEGLLLDEGRLGWPAGESRRDLLVVR